MLNSFGDDLDSLWLFWLQAGRKAADCLNERSLFHHCHHSFLSSLYILHIVVITWTEWVQNIYQKSSGKFQCWMCILHIFKLVLRLMLKWCLIISHNTGWPMKVLSQNIEKLKPHSVQVFFCFHWMSCASRVMQCSDLLKVTFFLNGKWAHQTQRWKLFFEPTYTNTQGTSLYCCSNNVVA